MTLMLLLRFTRDADESCYYSSSGMSAFRHACARVPPVVDQPASASNHRAGFIKEGMFAGGFLDIPVHEWVKSYCRIH